MISAFMENFLLNNLIINLSFFLVWVLAMTVFPDFVYEMNTKFFTMDKKDWYRVNYMLMGFYKILFILFVVAPYVALKLL